jgi:hypothetical protein
MQTNAIASGVFDGSRPRVVHRCLHQTCFACKLMRVLLLLLLADLRLLVIDYLKAIETLWMASSHDAVCLGDGGFQTRLQLPCQLITDKAQRLVAAESI